MFLACVEEQGCVVSKGIGCLYSSCSTVTKKWKMQHLLYQTIFLCFSVLLSDVFLDAFNQY